jgi:YfiH family protein
VSTTHEQHRNRLPDPGAGFVWDTQRHGVGPYPVLRPDTNRCRAVYTTRVGGVSEAPFDELNVSMSVGDGLHRVLANRDLAARGIGSGAMWSTIKQVHGADVVVAAPVRSATGTPTRRQADAQWTEDADVTLAVLSADCVLLLLVGDVRVGVVHAGWRGIVAGIVERAVEAVRADLVFAGPAIGPCCFEVGHDVTDEFRLRYRDAVVDDRHVDLWGAAEAAARSSGAAAVHSARLCTSCHAELFFSHRRDRGLTGRQALVARIS